MVITDVKMLLQNKAKLIIMIGLLGALCVASFKFLFTPYKSVQGDFIYCRIIQVEDMSNLTNSHSVFDYQNIVFTTHGLLRFLECTDGKTFDFSKINTSWKNLNQQDKIAWLRKRFSKYSFRDNVFEIVFSVPSSYNSDPVYLSKNAEALMDAFVLSGSEIIREVKPNTVIKTVNSSVISPTVIKNDKKAIAMRYGVYGFIGGVFFSIAVLIGFSLFKMGKE